MYYYFYSKDMEQRQHSRFTSDNPYRYHYIWHNDQWNQMSYLREVPEPYPKIPDSVLICEAPGRLKQRILEKPLDDVELTLPF